MAFDPNQPKLVGKELVDMIYGVGDGVDFGDLNNAMELMTALGGAANELKEDKDAAVFFVLSGAMDELAKRRLNAPPTTTS